MKKKRIRFGILLTAFTVFGMSVLAQTTTMKVMKGGLVLFESEVTEIEKMYFQDPSGTSSDVLVVNKSNGSSAEKTLLDNIEQLTFSGGNLTVELVSGSYNYSFSDIAQLTFDQMTTGINNLQAQGLEVIVYVNSEGSIEVKCAAEIKSLTLFTVDGKTIATVKTWRAASLPRPPAGVYLLAVETTQGTVVKKLIINN